MLSRRRFLASASTLAAGVALPGSLAQASNGSAERPAGGASRRPEGAPKNVILMIPDGFGIASQTAARMALGRRLTLDTFMTGHTDTRSADNFVTDSAAAATALASGQRTYNGAVGLDEERRPLGTVLEAAKTRGLRTGLVTTTRITHATPAGFAAHVPARGMEAEIAEQMLAVGPDVMLGGGIEFFQPDGERTDGRDLIAEAREAGYALVYTADEMERASGRVLGLFSESHMAYEVDRAATEQPSLAAMTRKALALLDGRSGFFVMIEGGRIDHAAHGNDPVAHLHDVIAYDEAVAEALAFAERDGETLVLSVADHETGGFSIGRDGRYGFESEILLQSTASAEGMMMELARRTNGDRPDIATVESVLLAHAAFDEVTDDERAALALALQSESRWEPGRTMAQITSARALVGWTTGGHTGEDVTLHAAGPGREHFMGFLDNTDVALRIAELLALDLDAETARLRESFVPEAVEVD